MIDEDDEQIDDVLAFIEAIYYETNKLPRKISMHIFTENQEVCYDDRVIVEY